MASQREDDHCSTNRIEIDAEQRQQRPLASNIIEQDNVVVEDIENQTVDIRSPTLRHELERVSEMSQTQHDFRSESASNYAMTSQREDGHCSTNRIEIDAEQRQQRPLASNIIEQDNVAVEDIENQTVDIRSPTLRHELECVGEMSQTQHDQLRYKNEKTHVNVSNSNTNSNSMLVVWDENFKDNNELKAFSKKYILQHMLWALNSGQSEVVYLNYLNFLRDIKQYFNELSYGKINDDFMAALINAWGVFQKSGITSNHNSYLDHVKTSNGSSGPESIEENENPQTLTRIRIIELLLASDSNATRYRKYLKELNDAEKGFERN